MHRLGPKLLSLLMSPRAVALNRAAAADPTGERGIALSGKGGDTIAPLIANVLKNARDQGHIALEDVGEVTAVNLGLLIGDLQIRGIIGRISEPAPDWIEDRSSTAVSHLLALFGKRK
ncbi:MAG: TetR/AcrR family transcriptional regulator C-terminal domain-containing protein [Pseudomonadota bacterium]